MRQYIGARYVPKFMGTYDATQSYEALCVVDNGLGTSYISKVPTPANTPLTYTTYWAIYGASSGAIINLQNQIDDMNDGSVPGSLQEQINTNASNITALQNAVSLLNNTGKILFIGDSYDTYVVGRSWIDETATYLNLNYSKLSAGGYGFDGVDAGNVGNYIDLVNNATFTDPDDYTTVVICGGLNDGGLTEAQTHTAMASFKTGVRAVLPNVKKFYIGYIGFIAENNPTFKSKVFNTIDYYKSYCDGDPDFTFIENSQYIFADTRNLDYYHSPGSNFHPSADGITRLVRFLVNYFKNGYASYQAYYTYTFAIDNTNFSATTPAPIMSVSINNNQFIFKMNNDISAGSPLANWASGTNKSVMVPAANTNSPLYSFRYVSMPLVTGANMASASYAVADGRFANGYLEVLSYTTIPTTNIATILCFALNTDFRDL